MTWNKGKIKQNCHVLVNQFHGKFYSKALSCGKIKYVHRNLKWCFNASWGLKGLNKCNCSLHLPFVHQTVPKQSPIFRLPIGRQLLLNDPKTITFSSPNDRRKCQLFANSVHFCHQICHLLLADWKQLALMQDANSWRLISDNFLTKNEPNIRSFGDEKEIVVRSFGKYLASNWRAIGERGTN